MAVNYVGHAEKWDCLELDGDPARRDCAVTYKRDGRTVAQATISRDQLNLKTEAAMEKELNRPLPPALP